MTSLLVFVNAILAATASLLAWPVLASLRLLKRLRRTHRPIARRVVILGLDGFSPEIAGTLMSEGLLPELSALAGKGTFTKLATTRPGISPVAWSSFSTGVNPGKHGIFDFLAPDRRRHIPVLSSVATGRDGRGRPFARMLRRSEPFWKRLGALGLRSTILRVPITYPPEKLDGFLLSGMCVPDLRGTQGSYTLFGVGAGHRPGGIEIPLAGPAGGTWSAGIPGPEDGGRMLTLPVGLSRNGKGWKLTAGSSAPVSIEPGSFTPWIRLAFRRVHRSAICGIVRFRLTVDGDRPLLYMTAIHPDPFRPPVPVSHPQLYSSYLAGLLGPYATLGLAEDTWALMDGAVDEEAFLDYAWQIFGERRRMLADALRRNRTGLVVCVFDTSDRIQHMFWRQGIGPGSPIREMYRKCDALVGEVAGRLGRGDMLLVISDHGFASFDTCVDLNRFLIERGFMVLQDGVGTVSDSFEGVDWSRTRAYAMGLAGIHLNLAGREGAGIVQPGAGADAVTQEIIEALLDLRDGEGASVVLSAERAASIYSGPYIGGSPDILVGMRDGFRASWNCVTGGAGREVIYPNDRHWCGDHCCDSALVPGILFSNRILDCSSPSILDMAPTVLDALGTDPPPHLDGRSLLRAAKGGTA